MNPNRRSPTKQFCKSTLALLLAVQALSSLMNNPWMNAYSDDTNYANFHSAAEVRAAAERNIAMAARAAAAADVSSDGLPLNTDSPPPAPSANASPLPESMVPEESAYHEPAAAPSPVATNTFNPIGSLALGDDSLDDVRGGFDIVDTNLKYSFGIDRAVFINGELVAHTTLNLKDLDQMAGKGEVAVSQLASKELSTETVSVVQNGAGNTFMTQVGPAATGTVIQNTLNNQRIQNVTTINAAVNSAQVFKAMSVQSAIQNGIVNSLRR